MNEYNYLAPRVRWINYSSLILFSVLISESLLPFSVTFISFLYLIFYGRLRLRFLDVETNPGPHRPVPAVCRILCSNVRGLAGNLSDLTVASSQYGILLCSETLVSYTRHVSEVLVHSFCRPLLFCRGTMPLARGMAAYVRDGYGAFRTQI